MNSKAAQLKENGTEIVRLFARFALGASFLSAVADRFGLLGPYGAKNVSWGDFAHFAEYTGAVTSLLPRSLTLLFAWASTVAETLFGILLIAGFKTRIASALSGVLLLLFAMGMVTGLGIKKPLDYSVFSAAAAAFLLAFWDSETEQEIQMKTQYRRLMWHGMLLSLLGLITGLLEQRFTNVRMGLAAHLEGVMNGIFLLALGAEWNEVRLPHPAKVTAYCAALYGTYVNWLVTSLGAAFGTAASSPITSAGHSGQPWQESFVAMGFLSVSIAIVVTSILVLSGLRGTPAEVITTA